MRPRPFAFRPPGADYDVHVLGGRRAPLRDFYYALQRLSWPATISALIGSFVFANALFAVLFVWVGGVEHARPGSLADAFYFSVQTMGTIGYGAMYPQSHAANVLVVVESLVGLTLTALSTGLIFAKFSRPTARIMFSRYVALSPMNGVPTLALRVGNERNNNLVDVHFRATVSMTERTAEGLRFFPIRDLKLVRDHAISLSRSLYLLHVVDEQSPFFGQSPESIIARELELQLLVVGMDDTATQTVHATKLYLAKDIAWGMRLADVISEREDGSIVLDLRQFHALTPSVPTPTFPYPKGTAESP